MLDWIIIGGGIQGITVASYLVGSKKVTIDNLMIIDPHDEPLTNWKVCTRKINMPFLRSPFIHHIDVDPFSLQKFVRKKRHEETAFYGRYKRPNLEIFNEHCEEVIQTNRLKECWSKGYVTDISKEGIHWIVQVNHSQQVKSRNVILALGLSEQPKWPGWAKTLKEHNEAQVFHIFDETLESLHTIKPPVTVVGGGITAVHTALHLAQIFPGEVTLLKRHPFRLFDFDSNPGWLGPKYMRAFHHTTDFKERRQMIVQARNRGSITRELYVKVKTAVREKRLIIQNGQVQKADYHLGKIDLYLSEALPTLSTTTLLLTTGFDQSLPGKQLLQPLIHAQQLKCSECGYPIVNHQLQWGPNLYVAGALAELEIGPTARNVAGARKAAEAIVRGI
ncbi:FAD-dependent oxidoreductase [Bacillus pinisoli]|uniref:FAD-dependent oxidoreductase n=1 Tax=Bacillus pinisoli TaxID=2901866 RepID=UPI001FF51E7C|nr:FAD/NAD(P)-binding protein [Bacillus pinisoli]